MDLVLAGHELHASGHAKAVGGDGFMARRPQMERRGIACSRLHLPGGIDRDYVDLELLVENTVLLRERQIGAADFDDERDRGLRTRPDEGGREYGQRHIPSRDRARQRFADRRGDLRIEPVFGFARGRLADRSDVTLRDLTVRPGRVTRTSTLWKRPSRFSPAG